MNKKICDFNFDKENKCAPGVDFKDGTCFSIEQLIEIKDLYNKSNPDNKIKSFNGKKDLLKILIKKFKDVYDCNDQICWVDKIGFIKKNYNLKNFVFRPKGPINSVKWLSTTDIDKSMRQYQNKHKDFFYLGTLPNDFKYLDYYGIENFNFEKKIANNVYKFGCVINLDNHDESGSHWVSLFFDLKDKKIYFFDSFAKKPGKRISEFIKKMILFMDKKTDNIFKNYDLKKKYLFDSELEDDLKVNNYSIDYKYNKIRHQFKNSECGVYSMNFIIRLLNGESFEDITNNITKDDKMNSCRNVYFR